VASQTEGGPVKGYIYTTGKRADPGLYNNLDDPLFGDPPTLGACMSNLREFLNPGDYIFVISASVPVAPQYIIGGLRVAEKIDHLTAYGRFPQNRLKLDENGVVRGNIIVDDKGDKHPLDHHDVDSFDKRIKNFIVGDEAVALRTQREVELGRERTLSKLSDVFSKPGNRPFDIIGRQRKLDEQQVHGLMNWLRGIKSEAKTPS
jgi:hypothetical protein